MTKKLFEILFWIIITLGLFNRNFIPVKIVPLNYGRELR